MKITKDLLKQIILEELQAEAEKNNHAVPAWAMAGKVTKAEEPEEEPRSDKDRLKELFDMVSDIQSKMEAEGKQEAVLTKDEIKKLFDELNVLST
tara:strand:- start:989 stop:1273 length:285 start_codon:yes stop_codon:yes gene_type:complete